MTVSVRVVDPTGDDVVVDVDADADMAAVRVAVSEHFGSTAHIALELNGEMYDDAVLLSETGWDVDDVFTMVTRPFFQVGHRLEARDRKHPGLLCPATVIAVDGRRIKVHFDGWTDVYDYWTEDNTLDIAPCGTCDEQQRQLQRVGDGKRGWDGWGPYLLRHDLTAAPRECFVVQDYFSNR